MKRANLARTSALLVMLASIGCAEPDAVPGDGGGGNTGPSTGPGGPSTVVGTEVSWVRTFGDTTGVLQRGRDVTFDPKSNTLVTTVDFDPALEVVGLPGPIASLGTRDIFVLRYPSDGGVPLWGTRIGGIDEQFRATVAVDLAGNVIVAGGFYGSIDFAGTTTYAIGLSDVFVAKLDPDGKEVWLKTYGDGDVQFATDVAVDDEGNILLVGVTRGQIDFGLGPATPVTDRDLFVAKLDPAGAPVWGYRPGRAADEDFRSPSIAITSTGGGKVAVTGASEGLLAFPPIALTAKGDGDAFLALLDGQGQGLMGSALFGAMATRQRSYAVAASADRIAITGEMSGAVNFGGVDLQSGGGADAFVAVYDASGVHQWSRRFGGPATQSGRGVAIDRDGNVIVAGINGGVIEFFGENAFVNVEAVDAASDGFATKLDPTGTVVWAMSMTGPLQQVPSAVACLSDGSAVVSGWYETELSPSGSQTLPSTGGADGFILSLAP